MFKFCRSIKIDWYLVIPATLLSFFALFTLISFGEVSTRFIKQSVWILFGLVLFIFLQRTNLYFLKNRKFILIMYALSIISLLILFVSGHMAKGAQSWIKLGFLSIQPTDPAKLVLIILLAKYFSKRYVEISVFKHVFISGIYAGVLCLLVLLQPDFGSAMTIFSIWAGIIFISGLSKKHILILGTISILILSLGWQYAFKQYQKDRIINFIHPMRDIRGSGYNQYQAVIAVGSGQILGKGVGYGTQSKLKFLPEYQTDFIFSAFAEEWGFVGVFIVLILFLMILLRILFVAMKADTNFDALIAAGVFIFFGVHILINIGMNLGIMPITGIPLPFMSYGGSHILIEFISLGIVSNISMRKKNTGVHMNEFKNEFLGFN
jgi:rod shape determining protein RodA